MRAVEDVETPRDRYDHEAMDLLQHAPLEQALAASRARRDRVWGTTLTYSRKVFIPLTQLCRDVCHYCTFAKSPTRVTAAYLTPDEVLAIARAGAAAGCKEALFTLGDKPELRYEAARVQLKALGFHSTIAYLEHTARLVLRETGLLPHLNPGVLTADDIALLRPVAASMGLMLESVSERLCEKGGPHHGSPDKRPAVRLQTLECAGRAHVPMTTGLLIGIGETRGERIDSLLAIRTLHRRFGHIQEVIIQNFRAKTGTRMAHAAEPSEEELQWTIAAARLLLDDDIGVQSPPNLNQGRTKALIAAGLNDWGGISPVTIDHVNPEAAWPEIANLAGECAESGHVLAERLAVYPLYLRNARKWLDAAVRPIALAASGTDGLAREHTWCPGQQAAAPGNLDSPLGRSGFHGGARPGLDARLDRIAAGHASSSAIAEVFAARGDTARAIVAYADELRRRTNGDNVTYVVNRNINYTNICTYRCGFCAFSKTSTKAGLRDTPYLLSAEEVAARVREARTAGATEVCLQGGIHPTFTGETYRDICRAVKTACPDMHVHAFSPLEISHGAETLGIPVERYLETLKGEGLGSLPGTAAEILHDDVRAVICPDKLTTAGWLSVVRAAHRVGLRTTATIMFGHVDSYKHWADHLLHIRHLQSETGGFTEFVPLPFVHMQAPIFVKGDARAGPTWRECILMHAAARIVLHGEIDNIQASWVKLGLGGAAACLAAGANDIGGVLMNESISRAAGASHGQSLDLESLAGVLSAGNRPLVRRTTLYLPA